MTKSLLQVKKDLKAFAKRCKDFKYTDSALFTFLLCGMLLSVNLFSAATTDSSIENQVQKINTSISQIRTNFKRAKIENNKLIKGTNLELIQLMEQGDQVVKDPFANWQFGINYFHSNWGGTYKGRGNKTKNVIYQRDPNNKFGNYTGADYGRTSLKRVIEPISAIPVDAAVKPKNIEKIPPVFTVAGADGGFPSFETRTVPSISRIEITTPTAISTFNPPALSFVGSGFWQGQGIGTRFNGGSVSSSVYLENYTSYDTDGIFRITMEADDETVNWTGKMTATSTEDPTKDITMSPSGTYTGPTSGAIQARLNAFINELRDHDATIGGTYIFENKGTRQKTFLSHNPAGVHTTDGMTTGRTATFTGNLNLISSSSGLTVGVEHQLWDKQNNDNGYSVFNNNGIITLSSGDEIVGIMIDSENYNIQGAQKKNNNQTKNTGKIIINSTESIGMDFGFYGDYPYLPVDVTLGDIEVNGTKNYGFRMRNHGPSGGDNSYYDDVTVSGGGSGKTITVKGEENVGIAIGQSLSSGVTEQHTRITSGSLVGPYTESGNLNYERLGENPLSNFFGTNVKVSGVEGVGILRMSGYSANNTNDFIFFDDFTDNKSTVQTGNIGTFDIHSATDTTYLDGGITKKRHGATNNVLLRTDAHGMQNQGTITINGSNGGYVTYQDPGDSTKTIEDAAGNIIMLANGSGQKVINYGKILQTNSGLKNTVGLVALGTGEAKNGVLTAADANNAANHSRRTKNDTARANDMVGKIEMAGAGSIGMYITSGSTGENSGEIKLTGADGRNVGIFNEGTVKVTGGELTSGTSDGKIEVTGKNSVGLFNETTGNSTIKLENAGGTKALNVSITGNNGANGIYAKGGTVTADDSKNAATNPTSTKGELKIKVTDTGTAKGVGVYAEGSAAVTLKYSDINVNNGTGEGGGGIYALNTSNVNVEGATITYNGEGYALYTENSGIINADNSKIKLLGKAVGFNIKGTGGTYVSNVSLSGAGIDIDSDDVILLGVTDPTSHNLSNFDSVLLGASGVSLSNIGGTATDYKIAVLDGINNGKSFKIDQVLDKSQAVTPTSLSTATQSYKYVRNLLLQRSIIDVNADVKAVLSSSDAVAMKSPDGAVVGLYVTATKDAANNSETGINVNNVTITSDRTDAGAGAIGLYTDYGKINIANSSTLNIEMDNTNTVNEKAVGVYAVNNSVMDNNGTINVGGNKSIGLLGLSYRQDSSGNVIGNEFGKLDEGKIRVNNNGNLVLDGESAKGILVFNNSSRAPLTYLRNGVTMTHPTNITSVADNVAINDTNGKITLTGEKAVGIYADEATATNKGLIDLQGAKGQIGLYGTTTSGISGRDSVLQNDITGTIKVGNSTLASNTEVPNIGIFTESKNQVVNNGTINIGNDSYGIYAKNIKEGGTSVLTVNQNGVGIFAVGESGTPGNVIIDSGAKVTVNNGISGKEGVAVFTGGSNTVNVVDNGSIMDLKDSTFGFVLKAPGSFVNTNTGNVKLANDSIYAYTDNSGVNITNNAPITSTGDRNYGLYGNGTMVNNGIIDFSTGNGNVGMYATTSGIATNFGNIRVGASNTAAKEFGVGMATGYYNETTDTVSNQGTIINHGTIEVSKPNTMGMYAVGSGSKAINYGDINLSGSNTIGMYLDRGAVGENWGTIKTTASGLRAVKGIYLANGSYIKNYGTITIGASDMKSAGIWADTQSAAKAQENAAGTNPTTGTSQTGASNLSMRIVTADDMKEMGGVTIKVPPRSTAVTVTDANGNVIPIVNVDTNTPLPSATLVTVTSPSGITTLDLSTIGLGSLTSASEATSLGMYVDTSGVNYTNPIQGISNLAGLEDINLFFGSEAAKYTTAKAIEIGDNILKPYNDALAPIVTAGTTLNSTAASLTWMAQPTKNAATGLLDKVYLVKIPYTTFAKAGDTQTYNFLAGLEERYGAEGLGTKEKSIFDKLNSLTGGEGHILAQAIDEMKGHQYSNIQQRMFETGGVLSKEFNYLQDEWRNPSKNSNKIKVFGQRGEFKTDTAGVVDYANNAYGVAYVHENEKIKLGNKSGWYAGSVYNKFKFKDIGKSQEEQTMIKAGVFKTMSPKKDYNGSLTWKIAGEAFAGRGDMKRRYWIVDEVFEAKGKYTTYGIALKNEIGKEFRTSENTSIRPYGALNLEYGKYSDFRETGPMALKVKGNDYFSAKPEAGISFNYKQDLGVRSKLTASLTAAYENELGELYDVQNKAKLKGTKAPYYKLRGDKENHRGNGKFDLNFGWDNTRFGVTVNAGYDTTGENFRGGIGFRAIY